MRVTQIQNRLFNAQANIEAIHPLQGLVTERIPDWLEDFIDFIIDRDTEHPIFTALPTLKNMCSLSSVPSNEEFLDALQYGNEKGFIFYGDWEVRRYIDDNSFYSGPGYRRIIWLYADTIEAGFEALAAAAEADHEKQKAKAGEE